MYKIDLYSDLSIYKQIIIQTKQMIIDGVLVDGDKILSIRELANVLGINASTVAKAYSEMELEGMIKTSRGRGTFISVKSIDKDKCMKVLKEELKKPILNAVFNDIACDDIINIIKEVYVEVKNATKSE